MIIKVINLYLINLILLLSDRQYEVAKKLIDKDGTDT